MAFKVQVDAAKIASVFAEWKEAVERDIKKSMGELAAITHAKVKDDASIGLKHSKVVGQYMENLGWEAVSDGVWCVYLKEPALWIEDGIKPGTDMKPGLLKGKKYRVIPFRYDKGPTQNSDDTNKVIDNIKSELRQQDISKKDPSFNKNGNAMSKVPFKNIEYDKNGSPKVGKLHQFDFGGQRPGKGNTPQMNGLSIYQSVKNGKARRDILTFRTVSSGPASEGKWIHPGFEGKKYLDAAADWALKEWENTILPGIIAKWGGK